MKAIGYRKSLPIDQPLSLIDIEMQPPKPDKRDLLVEVRAVSVNPVDTKVRKRFQPSPGDTKILGWDASGIVREVGAAVTQFKPGDEVWYAGAIDRPGCNAELHLVDERIVAKKPNTLSFAEAAAMPLTSITAWELLFDRFGIARHKQTELNSLLIIGAAGGVGSMLTQLAHNIIGLTVIGTASRTESKKWIMDLGADHCIDHSQDIIKGLAEIGIDTVNYVASLTHTDEHFISIAQCLAPQGKLGLIDDPQHVDITLLKQKSLSLHWEFMYTRSLFKTADMHKQHSQLTEVASMVDSGLLRCTQTEHFGKINADNLKRAHAFIESGKAIGKVVLEGF